MKATNVDAVKEFTAPARQKLADALNRECTLEMPSGLVDEFISFGTLLPLRRGERIISAGEVDDNLYIIERGIMRSWYHDGKREVTEAFGLPGTIVLSFHSYYDGQPSTVNFEACCPSRVLKVKRSDFDSLIERSHLFSRWCLRLAQCQLYHYEIRRRVIKGDGLGRYKALLSHRPEIIRNVPLKIIASYLGVTPEYLSNLRKKV